jgi:hypothetical protein
LAGEAVNSARDASNTAREAANLAWEEKYMKYEKYMKKKYMKKKYGKYVIKVCDILIRIIILYTNISATWLRIHNFKIMTKYKYQISI